ncbi:MAG: stomatin-like protein [Spirochaetota bacterium]
MSIVVIIFWVVFVLYIGFKLVASIRIVPTKEVLIVERWGRYHDTLHAGIHFMVPFMDRVAYRHTLKEQAIEVDPQICITKDNVQVKVDGVLYIVILDPQKASYGIQDYKFASAQLAQTSMRAIIGTMDLDKTFESRDVINQKIVNVIDEASEAWGIRVNRYEIQNLSPPKSVVESMEKQKTAELKKRSEISLSEGDRDSRINRSEGLMQEAINKSQGEMQKRINEAEGKAKEILSISQATAKSINLIADSIQNPGGKEAVKLRVTERYIQKMRNIAKEDNNLVLPMDLTNFESVKKSIDQYLSQKK